MEDLLKLAESIRRWKWLIVAVGLIAMLAALATTLGKDSSFTATSTVNVGSTSQETSRAPEQDAVVARGYVEGLLTTAAYQQKMFEKADIPDEVEISARNLVSGPLIAIDATSLSPDRAIAAAKAAARFFVTDTRTRLFESLDASLEPLRARLAQVSGEISGATSQLADSAALPAAQVIEIRGRLDALRAERVALVSDLQGSLSFAGKPDLVALVNEPEVASENRPAVVSNAVLGLLGGLVLGSAIALLLGALQLRVTSPSIVRSKLGLPTLASISGVDPQRRQEDLQGLASGLALMASGVSSVAITSPSGNEGKTLIASNIARYRAALGERVILIDANLRAEMLGGHQRESVGLAQLLARGDDVYMPDVLLDSGIPNLKLLPAGVTDDDPYALVTGERVSRVLERVAPFADLLVIDTAALLNAPESQVICSMADRTILVLDSMGTQTSAAVEARDTLARVQARVLGVVLTRTARRGGGLRRPPSSAPRRSSAKPGEPSRR